MNYKLYKDKYLLNESSLKSWYLELENKEKEFKLKEKNIENYKTAVDILNMLRTSKINSKRNKITEMITSGCQDIFQKDYELKILSNDELKKSSLKEIKYNIILYKNGTEVARNEKLLESSGGGVLSVISVLIKIIINIIYSKEKFFVFDESMSQVSESYQQRLSSFLKTLCEKQELTIVLITHMDNLSSYADYIYHFIGSFDKDNVPLLSLKRELKIDTAPYYELNLENFQSIKKMGLRFKGFTVIKGENDIGKSAVVRAINSIIYNDFKENYVRSNKPKTERTSITFSKVAEDKTIFSMNLIKNPTGIFYNINGEDYHGKQLSKDAIQNELEKNGFGSFINGDGLADLTNTKRNKISNLAITNQNDQLYLLDNTSAENNKIISYIFQATTINNGLLRIKEKVRDIAKESKFFQDEINKLKDKISKREKYVMYLKMVFYKELLKDLMDYQKQNTKLIEKSLLLKTIYKNTETVYLLKSSLSLMIKKDNFESLKNRTIKIKTVLEKIETDKLSLLNQYHYYKNLITWKNKKSELNSHLILWNKKRIEKDCVSLKINSLKLKIVLEYKKKLNDINTNKNSVSKKLHSFTPLLEKKETLKKDILTIHEQYKKINSLKEKLILLKTNKGKIIVLLNDILYRKTLLSQIDNNEKKQVIKLENLKELVLKYIKMNDVKKQFNNRKELVLKMNTSLEKKKKIESELAEIVEHENSIKNNYVCKHCEGKGYIFN